MSLPPSDRGAGRAKAQRVDLRRALRRAAPHAGQSQAVGSGSGAALRGGPRSALRCAATRRHGGIVAWLGPAAPGLAGARGVGGNDRFGRLNTICRRTMVPLPAQGTRASAQSSAREQPAGRRGAGSGRVRRPRPAHRCADATTARRPSACTAAPPNPNSSGVRATLDAPAMLALAPGGAAATNATGWVVGADRSPARPALAPAAVATRPRRRWPHR